MCGTGAGEALRGAQYKQELLTHSVHKLVVAVLWGKHPITFREGG